MDWSISAHGDEEIIFPDELNGRDQTVWCDAEALQNFRVPVRESSDPLQACFLGHGPECIVDVNRPESWFLSEDDFGKKFSDVF